MFDATKFNATGFNTVVRPHVCCVGRSDTPAHPRTSCVRRSLCHGSGAAASNVAARRFKTFARVGKRGARPPPTRWPGASFEVGSKADAAGAGVDRGVPEVLG